MRVGTKSLLFGVHQVFLHPLFVAWAWWKLYGFPRSPRLWLAFVIHDWGYWGCKTMDGPGGDNHPYLGARIMHWVCGSRKYHWVGDGDIGCWEVPSPDNTWYYFALCHSRYLAKQIGLPYSKLCVADKFSMTLYPWWLYRVLATLSGELKEYLASAQVGGKHQEITSRGGSVDGAEVWFRSCCTYLAEWCVEHREIKEDTWTKI